MKKNKPLTIKPQKDELADFEYKSNNDKLDKKASQAYRDHIRKTRVDAGLRPL